MNGAISHFHNDDYQQFDNLDVITNFVVHSKVYTAAQKQNVDVTIQVISRRGILNIGTCTHKLAVDLTCSTLISVFILSVSCYSFMSIPDYFNSSSANAVAVP